MDALTASLLREADAFGHAPSKGIDWSLINAQTKSAMPQRNAEAQQIIAREAMPDGGGAMPITQIIPESRASQSVSLDPVTAALISESEGKSTAAPQAAQQPSAAPQSREISLLGTPLQEAMASQPDKLRDLGATPKGVGEVGLQMLTGLGSTLVGGYEGLLAAGGALRRGADLSTALSAGGEAVKSRTDRSTYQPTTEAGKGMSTALASPYNPLNWPGLAGKAVGEKIADVTGSPGAAAIGETAVTMAPLSLILGGKSGAPAAAKTADAKVPLADVAKGIEAAPAAEVPKPRIKLKVSAYDTAQTGKGAPEIPRPTIEQTTPQFRDAVAKTVAKGDVNQVALGRHIEADSLPIPVRLTEGQATGDIVKISNEMNLRAKGGGQLAQQFAEQNSALLQNVNAIRERVAPKVTGTNHVENGQAIIDAYKTKDAALSADISAKYKALTDANSGNLPVDGVAFAKAADEALSKKMKGRYVPPEIQADMAALREGGPMTFEMFENMRTNLAAEARKAERAGDGNRAMAVSIVRDALESLPIAGETAAIKPLADAARQAAKARFDLLKKDPAYKAAVNDAVAADDFISRFVVNGKASNVKEMKRNLSADEIAQQTIAAGAINFLKSKAGIVNDTGNFNNLGYNKALEAMKPKLLDLVPPDTASQLVSLGNVARYTQEQPKGSFVNNSNTFVASLGDKALSTAEGVANVAAHGVPVGSWMRRTFEKGQVEKKIKKATAPGAGIKK
jgi:hypothetical protein